MEAEIEQAGQPPKERDAEVMESLERGECAVVRGYMWATDLAGSTALMANFPEKGSELLARVRAKTSSPYIDTNGDETEGMAESHWGALIACLEHNLALEEELARPENAEVLEFMEENGWPPLRLCSGISYGKLGLKKVQAGESQDLAIFGDRALDAKRIAKGHFLVHAADVFEEEELRSDVTAPSEMFRQYTDLLTEAGLEVTETEQYIYIDVPEGADARAVLTALKNQVSALNDEGRGVRVPENLLENQVRMKEKLDATNSGAAYVSMRGLDRIRERLPETLSDDEVLEALTLCGTQIMSEVRAVAGEGGWELLDSDAEWDDVFNIILNNGQFNLDKRGAVAALAKAANNIFSEEGLERLRESLENRFGEQAWIEETVALLADESTVVTTTGVVGVGGYITKENMDYPAARLSGFLRNERYAADQRLAWVEERLEQPGISGEERTGLENARASLRGAQTALAEMRRRSCILMDDALRQELGIVEEDAVVVQQVPLKGLENQPMDIAAVEMESLRSLE